MGELRDLPAEPLVEQHVLRGRRDPFLAADDGVDAHQVIIDDDSEVIGREPVGLEDDLIIGARRFHCATDDVGEGQRDVVGNEHAHHGRLGEAGQCGAFFLRLAVAEAVVPGDCLLRFGLLVAHLLEPFGGTPAVVGVAGLNQLIDVGAVGVESFRLAVRAVLTADVRAFVRLQAEPFERVVDLLLGAFDEAGLVGVFDAEDELAAGLAGPGEIEQGHEGGADVGVARG